MTTLDYREFVKQAFKAKFFRFVENSGGLAFDKAIERRGKRQEQEALVDQPEDESGALGTKGLFDNKEKS